MSKNVNISNQQPSIRTTERSEQSWSFLSKVAADLPSICSIFHVVLIFLSSYNLQKIPVYWLIMGSDPKLTESCNSE